MTPDAGSRSEHSIVHVEPVEADLEVRPGETIIEAAWRLGYRWPTVCYGQAECGTCHLEVVAGDEHLTPMEDDEREAIRTKVPPSRAGSRTRLACRAEVTGDVRVRKPGVRPQESTGV